MENDLTPTGHCYSACADFLINTYFHCPEDTQEMRVVHGRPSLSRPPYIKYGHAWIELNGEVVYDPERAVEVPAVVYYAAGQIDDKECFYYDFKQLQKMIMEYNHYGPWEGVEGCPPISHLPVRALEWSVTKNKENDMGPGDQDRQDAWDDIAQEGIEPNDDRVDDYLNGNDDDYDTSGDNDDD